MNREMRIFVLAVGIPAVLLTVVGARLLFVEWRFHSHDAKFRTEVGPRMERPLEMPPPGKLDFGMNPQWRNGPPPPRFRRPERRPPPPPPIFRLFSSRYDMSGARMFWIGMCGVGLLFVSLVVGAWLLLLAARRSRLEALRQTDFVSNVSHEFKTPLTTICLCAELAQDEGIDPARRQRALAAIREESERLKRLVLNALDFSRLEKDRRHYNIRSLDAAAIVRETCAAFVPRFAEGQLLAPPEDPCTALVDDEALRQILANLLDNAAKYAPAGKVEVSVQPVEGKVAITVADHGPGLSPDALHHAFDRFWRGDNSVTRETGGSGLGLAIARALARGMGGELSVTNRSTGGALFTLELKS